MIMKVSVLLQLVTLGSVWLVCSCLPAKCEIQQNPHAQTLKVLCSSLDLTTIPTGIPPNAGKFTARSNSIRNVSHLPELPRLHYLDLSENKIEWFSWTSLRALPALNYLFLNRNRLPYVQLDIVIEYLPKLKWVDLSFNRLASLTQYELGWPQVTTAVITGNPFHCDCALSWLIDKMACLQACQGRDGNCCKSCSACFLESNLRFVSGLVCKNPSRLEGLSLTDVSNQLTGTGCEPHGSTTKPATVSTDEGTSRVASQSQVMVKSVLNVTARCDTMPKPTEHSKGAVTNSWILTDGPSCNSTTAKGITPQNILLSVPAGMTSCLTIIMLCCCLYKRKCYHIQADY